MSVVKFLKRCLIPILLLTALSACDLQLNPKEKTDQPQRSALTQDELDQLASAGCKMDGAILKCDDITGTKAQKIESLEKRRKTLDDLRLQLESDLSSGKFSVVEAIQAGVLIANLSATTSQLDDQTANLKDKMTQSGELPQAQGFQCGTRLPKTSKFKTLASLTFKNHDPILIKDNVHLGLKNSMQLSAQNHRVLWQSHADWHLQVETDGEFALNGLQPEPFEILCVKKSASSNPEYRITDPVFPQRAGSCLATWTDPETEMRQVKTLKFTSLSSDSAKIFDLNAPSPAFSYMGRLESHHGLINLTIQKDKDPNSRIVVTTSNSIEYLTLSFADQQSEALTISCDL